VRLSPPLHLALPSAAGGGRGAAQAVELRWVKSYRWLEWDWPRYQVRRGTPRIVRSRNTAGCAAHAPFAFAFAFSFVFAFAFAFAFASTFVSC
jgi:hypothetical protein